MFKHVNSEMHVTSNHRGGFPLPLTALYFDTRTHDWLDWLSRDPPVFSSSALGLQMHTTMHSFLYVGSGDPGSGPHACTVVLYWLSHRPNPSTLLLLFLRQFLFTEPGAWQFSYVIDQQLQGSFCLLLPSFGIIDTSKHT